MPGKTRVSALAKDLGIPARDVLAMLTQMGEYVKTASSTIEAPVAEQVRRRCHAKRATRNPFGVGSTATGQARQSAPARQHTGRRRYPGNNPYQDLGEPDVEAMHPYDNHAQAEPAARPIGPRPDWSRHRPTAPGVAPAAPTPAVTSPRRPRREWYRDGEPSDFERHVLDNVILPAGSLDAPRPQPPHRYFEDEVARAREITGRWAMLMLHGLDFDEVLAWRAALEQRAGFPSVYPDAPDHAVELHLAGVRPSDLDWRYGDEKLGTLPERLRRRTLTVQEVVVEVEHRRTTSD